MNKKLAAELSDLYQIYCDQYKIQFSEEGYSPAFSHFMIWLGAQLDD